MEEKLSTSLGTNVSFSGTAAVSSAAPVGPSAALVAQASEVVKAHGPEWMAHGNVIGVGVGSADENPYEAVVVVYVDGTQGNVPDLPPQARGFRVKRVVTDPFVAIGCCQSCRSH